MTNGWPMVPLGEVLTLRQPAVHVLPTETYHFAGVYCFGRGVFRGETRTGLQFAYKKLTRLSVDDLVYPKLMAWEGAIATVLSEHDGLVVSTEFPVFRVNPDLALPGMLSAYFRNPRVWPLLSGDSTGTNVRRRRLNPEDFLKLTIPLPPLPEQRRIVTKIEQLAAKIEEARGLQIELVSRCDSLCRSLIFAVENGTTPTPMSKLVSRRTADVTVEPDKQYLFAGVYCFGRGVFRGQRRLGSEFAYKQLTTLHAGDFVYPKLIAWAVAMAVVPSDCDGLVVSPEFPVFEVNTAKVLPEVLDVYFRTPSVWPQLSGASTGTNVRRRRLKPETFLAYRLPLPSMEVQQRLKRIKGKVEALKTLHAQTAADLDALLPSILDRAFKGEL